RHVAAERIGERDQHDRVDEDLRDALPAHLEALPAKQRVHQVAEHEQRDGKPERVGGRHQTRSSTYNSRKTNRKQPAATASEARSYMPSTLGRDVYRPPETFAS